jgi:hypothetical protein
VGRFNKRQKHPEVTINWRHCNLNSRKVKWLKNAPTAHLCSGSQQMDSCHTAMGSAQTAEFYSTPPRQEQTDPVTEAQPSSSASRTILVRRRYANQWFCLRRHARERTRTSTPKGHRPSTCCVYQFHHAGNLQCHYSPDQSNCQLDASCGGAAGKSRERASECGWQLAMAPSCGAEVLTGAHAAVDTSFARHDQGG